MASGRPQVASQRHTQRRLEDNLRDDLFELMEQLSADENYAHLGAIKRLRERLLHPDPEQPLHTLSLANPALRTYWMATKMRQAFDDPYQTHQGHHTTLSMYSIHRYSPDRRDHSRSDPKAFRNVWCNQDGNDVVADGHLLESVRYDSVYIRTLDKMAKTMDTLGLLYRESYCPTTRALFDSDNDDEPTTPVAGGGRLPACIVMFREMEAMADVVSNALRTPGLLTGEPEADQEHDNDNDITVPEGHVMLEQEATLLFTNAMTSLKPLSGGQMPGSVQINYHPLPTDLFQGASNRDRLDQFNPYEFIPESAHVLREVRGWSIRHLSELTESIGHQVHASRLSRYRTQPETINPTITEVAALSEVFRIPLSEWLFAITMDYLCWRPKRTATK